MYSTLQLPGSRLKAQGIEIFDQIPYEFGLRRLAIKWEEDGNNGYCVPILEVFYGKLIESGCINRGYFIPGWKSSVGARWERAKFVTKRYYRHDLNREDLRKFLAQAQHPTEYVEDILDRIQVV